MGTARPVINNSATQTGAAATGTTQIPRDDTIPQNTEGDEYMTLSHTPLNANNILEISVCWNGSTTGANAFTAALFKDSDANALAAGWTENFASTAAMQVNFTHRMTAGTISAINFKVRAGSNNSGTTTFNGQNGNRMLGGVMASSIIIREYTP
jgi:hypothetical protein